MNDYGAVQPYLLGAEHVSAARIVAMPKAEQTVVENLRGQGLGDRFWECYGRLREQGFTPMQACAGAWQACGRGQRGKFCSQAAFADLLGRERKWLQRQLAPTGTLFAAAMALRGEYWAERVPDVDERLYTRVMGIEATTADFKLAYQRARVALSGEDADATDDWQKALAQAKAESEG